MSQALLQAMSASSQRNCSCILRSVTAALLSIKLPRWICQDQGEMTRSCIYENKEFGTPFTHVSDRTFGKGRNTCWVQWPVTTALGSHSYVRDLSKPMLIGPSHAKIPYVDDARTNTLTGSKYLRRAQSSLESALRDYQEDSMSTRKAVHPSTDPR